MSDEELAVWFAKFVIGGSIILIIYIVYYEYKTAKTNEQNSRIKLEEKENEDLIGNLSEQQLVDMANQDVGRIPSDIPPAPNSANTKKPTG